MGKGTAKQQVNEYYMSIHSGLCVGPVDAITGLFVGEKLAWTGEVTQEAAIYINAPSLFGGSKDGGGVGGIMYYLPGGPTQVFPNDLAARQGLSSATSPAYRGIASVYFIGTDDVPTGSIDISGNTGGDGGNTGGGGSSDTGGGIGGDGSGSPGGGGSCPVTSAMVLLPNGRTKPIGSIEPGVDYVWTAHETTGLWGAHLVTHKRIVEEPTWTVEGRPRTSASHRWRTDDGWVQTYQIGEPTGDIEKVVALTVDSARTYTLVADDGSWHVSHNVKNSHTVSNV